MGCWIYPVLPFFTLRRGKCHPFDLFGATDACCPPPELGWFGRQTARALKNQSEIAAKVNEQGEADLPLASSSSSGTKKNSRAERSSEIKGGPSSPFFLLFEETVAVTVPLWCSCARATLRVVLPPFFLCVSSCLRPHPKEELTKMKKKATRGYAAAARIR